MNLSVRSPNKKVDNHRFAPNCDDDTENPSQEDDLSEDVPLKYAGLKYENRGGEVFVSLDQYKSSSPSCSKTPSNSNDNLSEDVPLKYEKRGGEVWVSLDQYKLSSPSSSKTPSNAKKDENLTLNTKIAVMKFTNEI